MPYPETVFCEVELRCNSLYDLQNGSPDYKLHEDRDNALDPVSYCWAQPMNEQ